MATEARRALVKGGGEVGTAVALGSGARAGRWWSPSLERPTVLRRQLSLAEAAYVGQVWRGGVRVERAPTPVALERLLGSRAAFRRPDADRGAEPVLPLFVGPLTAAPRRAPPDGGDRRTHAARRGRGAPARRGSRSSSGSGPGCARARTWTWSSRRALDRRWARRSGAVRRCPHRAIARAPPTSTPRSSTSTPNRAGFWRTAHGSAMP